MKILNEVKRSLCYVKTIELMVNIYNNILLTFI